MLFWDQKLSVTDQVSFYLLAHIWKPKMLVQNNALSTLVNLLPSGMFNLNNKIHLALCLISARYVYAFLVVWTAFPKVMYTCFMLLYQYFLNCNFTFKYPTCSIFRWCVCICIFGERLSCIYWLFGAILN